MKHRAARFALVAAVFFSLPVVAEPAKLKVKVEGLDAEKKLPLSAAFCAPPSVAAADHNISPAISWSKAPRGAKSFVLIMTDLDVPKDMSLMNKPGVTIAAEAPRMPFVHWLLVDIPPTITHLAKGAESDGFLPKGNPVGPTDHGLRGANVYSNFYPKDSPLAGPHGGYDGPCPPGNDLKIHRYVFSVYALDIKSLGLDGVFFGDAVQEKMQGHILAQGEATAIYGGPPKP